MKKMLSIGGLLAVVFILQAWIVSPAKSGDKGKPIPDNVMSIAQKTCVHCHTSPGNAMALSHVNLSKWDDMSAEKQATKAADMCKMMTKEKMPPKSYRDKHPKDVPTADEIKTVCDWATSIAVPKK